MLRPYFASSFRALWFVLLALVLAACSDNNPTNPTPTNPTPATGDAGPAATGNPAGSGATLSKTIGTNGGSIAVGNVSLDVPAGAVPADTQITVTESKTPAAADRKAVTPVYVFGPEGLKFNEPVNVTIAFHGDSKNLTVYWSDLDDPTKYAPVATKFTSAGAVAAVTHFSSGFVADLPAGEDASQCDGGTACPATPPSGACDSLCTFAPCDYDAQLCACQGSAWVCTDKTPPPTTEPTTITITATPAPGAYAAPTDVALIPSAPAPMQYTLDGSDPLTAGTSYSGPIHVATSLTIKAVAVPTAQGATGIAASFAYTITPATPTAPTFMPSPGTFSGSVDVSLASAGGAPIYYSTSGVDPTAATGTLYSAPIHLTADQTIKAVAVANGVSSVVVTGAYTVTPLTPAVAPTLTPAPGTFTSAADVSLATTTPNATIYYTLDGTNPTTNSLVYTGPLTIAQTSTIRAFAVSSNVDVPPSGVTSGLYTINIPPSVVATPSLNPGPGQFDLATGVDVTIATQTAGAAIHYTLDGTSPTAASALYSAAIHLSGNTTVKAIATKAGSTDSAVATGTYQFVTSPPVVQPNGGTFQGPLSVSLAAAAGTIIYTTDGTDPVLAGMVYTAPFTLTTTSTVRAYAQAPNALASSQVSALFTITPPQTVAPPSFSPGSGTYSNPISVQLSTSTVGASIYYTLDGTAPLPQTGTLYTGPIPVSTTTTIRAIGAMLNATSSSTVQATFTFAPAAPQFSVQSGSYDQPQSVALSTASVGATIYYTLDNTAPTTQSFVYTNPIAVNQSTVIRAIAVAADSSTSPQVSATYTLVVGAPVFGPSTGQYAGSVQVSLQSDTPGATIYYTINGPAPTPGTGLVYAAPFTVTDNANIQAIAAKSGLPNSVVTSAQYTIVPSIPQASMQSGQFTGPIDVSLSGDAGSAIYYTVDGSDPTSAATHLQYMGTPITITQSTTLKVVAQKSPPTGAFSQVATYTYVIP